MQPKHFLLVFLFPALIMSCNPTIPTGIVSYVSYSSNTLKVNSEGYGQTEVEIEDNAAVNAIQRLLFEGIAGSSLLNRSSRTPEKKTHLTSRKWSKVATVDTLQPSDAAHQ